ncbi:MAG: ABC transporter permease [Candidatus Baldrarchaeia archaeon]
MSIEATIVSILRSIIYISTPILLATLGEIYAERSGVLNLGIEGIMSMGAVCAFIITFTTGNPLLGVLISLIVGAILAFIHAFVSASLNANQVVSGLALAMFGLGLSSTIGQRYVGEVLRNYLKPVPVPVLSQIPIIGPAFFVQDIIVYMSYVLVVVLWFILFKTRWGLYIRAVGENPYTADAMGVNVIFVRYVCVILGGALAGLGGAYITLAYMPTWIEGITMGKGWIAIALVILAMWDPLKGFLATYFFCGVMVVAIRVQVFGANPYIINSIPYIATIIVMILGASETLRRRIGAPAALCKPFIREERAL